MLLTVILNIFSVVIITASIIINRKKKLNKRIYFLSLLSGLAVQIIAVISAIINSHFINLSIAVTAADLILSIPFIITTFIFITNDKIIEFIKKNGKWIKSICAGTSAVILFESFICNFGAFNLIMPSSPKQMIMPISSATINGGNLYDGILTLNSTESTSIEYPNLNSEVSTIYVDIEIEGASACTIDISHADETNYQYRNNSHINYIKDNENSKYIICSYSGQVEKLCFNVSAPDNASVKIKNIIINKNIPFVFSWTRFLIILTGTLFLIMITFCPFMKKSVKDKKWVFNTSSVVITILAVFVAVVLMSLRGEMVLDLFKDPDTNQINKELVDAFEAGQVSLLETPSQEMLELENPYDWSLRNDSGVSYPWDHLLYDGKYYSYYGIGSVLTLFLPYHLITDKYFSSIWATLLYSIIGIIFLTLAYCTFIKRLFPKISNGIAISGLVIIQAASFVWYFITIGNFYELAQVSGFAFLISGMFFLLRSNVFGERKISRINIAIATTLLSISVLCRAVLALYCLVALIFVYAGVKKIVYTSETQTYKANIKPIITFLLAAMIPFIIIGSIQMIYNYLRFDSFFDFGIKYSLTINDFTHTQFHIPLMLIAFYNYLFAVPKVSPTFPFITSNYDDLSVNGYYWLSAFSAAGMAFRAFPIVGYIFGKRAYKNGGSNKNIVTSIIISGCIIVPFIQMFLVWSNGYTPRYAIDFAWQMILGAFVILFVLHNKISKPMKKIMYNTFSISAVASVIVNFALTYEFLLSYGNIGSDMLHHVYSFGRLFEFWNIM